MGANSRSLRWIRVFANRLRPKRLCRFAKIRTSFAIIKFAPQSDLCNSLHYQNHQFGCAECIIQSLKIAADDPEILDDDILLFKHEFMLINDMHLITKAMQKFVEGYDFVARWSKPDGYFMTDSFFVKASAIRKLSQNLSPFTKKDKKNFACCEKFLTARLFDHIDRKFIINESHSNWGCTELGFYHIPPRTDTTQYTVWDKQNYATVFDSQPLPLGAGRESLDQD